LEISELVTLLAVNPRKILNLPANNIEEGAEADFVIFNPDKKWNYTLSKNMSKSANSPLINKEITGAVTGVFTKKQYHKLS
jgi:dihydroorotase